MQEGSHLWGETLPLLHSTEQHCCQFPTDYPKRQDWAKASLGKPRAQGEGLQEQPPPWSPPARLFGDAHHVSCLCFLNVGPAGMRPDKRCCHPDTKGSSEGLGGKPQHRLPVPAYKGSTYLLQTGS